MLKSFDNDGFKVYSDDIPGYEDDVWINHGDDDQTINKKLVLQQKLKSLPAEKEICLKLRLVKQDEAAHYALDSESEILLARMFKENGVEIGRYGYHSFAFRRFMHHLAGPRKIELDSKGQFQSVWQRQRTQADDAADAAFNEALEKAKSPIQQAQETTSTPCACNNNHEQRETVAALMKEMLTSPEFTKAVAAIMAEQQQPNVDTEDIVSKLMEKMSTVSGDSPSAVQMGAEKVELQQTYADVIQEKLLDFCNSNEFIAIIKDVTDNIVQTNINEQIETLAIQIEKHLM